jgi:toxin ParE1/3/4
MTTKRVRLTPQAERDIDNYVVYLAEEADVETAIRFFDAVHETIQIVFGTPGMGRIRIVSNPRLSGIRQWAVSGFTKYLMFYRSGPMGIEIVRVLHGARDIDRILDEDTHPQ